MNLKSVRKEIDAIDFELVWLLNKRMEWALRARKFKESVTDQQRENQVLQFIHKTAQGLITGNFCEGLFSGIMQESKRLQSLDLRLVGFQGEHGAYSEVAARKYFSDEGFIPCETFSAVFDGVSSGALDFGVVPVENFLGGTVTRVNELMVKQNLSIVGEVYLPIHHSLLVLPDTDYRDVRVVLSHPQALAQCRGFLERNNLEGRPYYDTAGAARMVFHERPEATAAIASELCADLYHLETIKERIEDSDANITRFVILAKERITEDANKCSIIFSTEHKAGHLFSVLQSFADKEINLTRIESMPTGLSPGQYVFFLDFQGSDQNPAVREILEQLEAKTTMFRLLGAYREAEYP